VDYTISGSGITFTTPPVSGTTFFATVLGDAQSVGTPSDGTVTPASIAAGFDFAFPNVNVTGVTTIASGSAATPSLSVTGDSNTGLLSPAANTLAVSTDGTERLRVDSSGQVGIGTASPGANLHISSTGDTIARVTSADGNGAFLDLGDASDPDGGRIVYDSGSNLTFSTASTERLRVDSSGRLGIGTTSPENNLHIADTSGPIIRLTNSTGTDGSFTGRISTGDAAGTFFAGINFLKHDTNDGEIRFRTKVNNKNQDTVTIVDGNVGIGTTSPSQPLTVNGIARFENFIEFAGSISTPATAASIYRPVDNNLAFGTASAERMRIDNSGRLLLGASSSAGANRRFQIAGTDANGASMSICRNTNNNDGVTIDYIKSRNGTYGSSTIVQSGDVIGKIQFRGDDGTDYVSQAASILAAVDGTPGTNDMPGRLVFSTTADGASSPTERMRIDSSGRLLVGSSSARTNWNDSSIEPKIIVEGAGDNDSTALCVVSNSGSTSGASRGALLTLARTKGTTNGSNTAVDENTALGIIEFKGNDGTTFTTAAKILAACDGTPGTDDMPGRLVFSTTADGSGVPTERMRIDSSGNVGIGSSTINQTSSGRTVLGINGSSNALLNFNHGDTLAGFMYGANDEFRMEANGTRPLIFRGNSNERMRIDSSGRLLIGTTAAREHLNDGSDSVHICLEGTTQNTSTLAVIRSSNNDGPAHFVLGKSRGGVGSTTVVQDGDTIGSINFEAADGNHLIRAGQISCLVDGTPGGDDMPGKIVFNTTANGSNNLTQRMRISNQGRVDIFASSATDAHFISSAASAGTSIDLITGKHSATSIENANNGTGCFAVKTNGNVVNTNNSYGAISDVKLKENIVDASSQWDDLKAVQVRNYNFKESTGQPTHTQLGVVAQEIETVSPGLIYETPDKDDEGNDLGTVTKSVNYSVLYMKAVKALQEAQTRIETLETQHADLLARVTALES
jgi:hypothetical protein